MRCLAGPASVWSRAACDWAARLVEVKPITEETVGSAALPDPGERNIPRYSQRALPAYRYVPGRHPHPTRDPGGHSYAPPVPRHNVNAAGAGRGEQWRFGIDLFNRFYFWEAHE